jgi:hypothetical protein
VGVPEIATLLCVLVGITAVIAAFAAVVARQAQRRGYGYWTWLLAGMLGNPVLFLVMLAVLPNRARCALREQFLADLQARLQARGQVPPAAASPVPPAATTATRSPGVSVGDLATMPPPLHSLGDEETRA